MFSIITPLTRFASPIRGWNSTDGMADVILKFRGKEIVDLAQWVGGINDENHLDLHPGIERGTGQHIPGQDFPNMSDVEDTARRYTGRDHMGGAALCQPGCSEIGPVQNITT